MDNEKIKVLIERINDNLSKLEEFINRNKN